MSWKNIPVISGPLRVAESAGATDSDLYAFRRLTGENRPDALDYSTFARYQNLSSWLYYQNPLARRLCDVVTDMVLGAGVQVDVERMKLGAPDADEAKKLITRFLNHPANEFDIRLPGLFTALSSVFGELFLPVFASPENGDIALGYLEHYLVQDVVFNPKNRMEAVGVIQKPPKGGEKAIWWRVIRAEQGVDTPSYPPHPSLDQDTPIAIPADALLDPMKVYVQQPNDFQYGGEIFYFRTNVIGTGRGRSALEPALDWLHAYDQFLFGDLRNANLQGSFIWDIEITGAEEAELEAKSDEIRKNPPRHGEFNVHNEKEKWVAVSPNLSAASHSELGSQVKRIIGLAMGVPSHLIGAEDAVNRTTSVSSDIPFTRRMEQRQRLLKYLVESIINYQLDQKRHVGILNVERPYPYRTVLPSLTAGEIVAQAEALYNTTQSVMDAVGNGITSMAEGRRIWYAYGVQEPDVPSDIQKKIDSEITSGIIADPVELKQAKAGAGQFAMNGGNGGGSSKDLLNGGDAKRGLRAKTGQGGPAAARRGET